MPFFLFVALILTAVTNAQTPGLYDTGTMRTFELTFSQTNWWQELSNNYSSKTETEADLTVDGVAYPRIGVRFRGNSSYAATGSSQKKSFNLKTDAFVPGQSLMGYDSLNLSNGFNDPTLVREVVSYEILRRYMPAPQANYVKLVINGESWGVYVNVQQMDKDFVREWFEDDEGSRYRCDPPTTAGRGNSAMQWLGSGVTPYQEAYDARTPTSPTLWTDLITACDVLNNRTLQQLPTDLPKVLNVDRALWYLGLNIVMVNLDSYVGRGNDYYLYFDAEHGSLSTLPWDMNESFGGYSASLSITERENLTPFWNETQATRRPLLNRTMQVASWRERYIAHIHTILNQSFDWAKIGARVAQLQSFIDAEVQADTKKLYSYALFQSNVTQPATINSGFFRTTVPGLRPLVEKRAAYLNGFADIANPRPQLQGLSHSPASPRPTEQVNVIVQASPNAATVSVFHRVNGAFVEEPMFDDGMHGEGQAGDGIYGAYLLPMPAGEVVEYYVSAVTSQRAGGSSTFGRSFLPINAEHEPAEFRVQWNTKPSDIWINEVLAKNETGIVDEGGENDDWLELRNVGAGNVVIGDMYLTDRVSNPTKWQIPAGTSLPPGGSYLVWCDEDGSQGPSHANFKLSASGEEVMLFDVDGATLLSQLSFGPQIADVSTGRFIEGAARLSTFLDPTPAQSNEIAGCGSRRYSALDPTTQPVALSLVGLPSQGTTMTYSMRGGAANTTHWLCVSLGAAELPLPISPSSLLMSSLQVFGVVSSSANGDADLAFTVPTMPGIVGAELYFQAWTITGAALVGSNGLHLKFCP